MRGVHAVLTIQGGMLWLPITHGRVFKPRRPVDCDGARRLTIGNSADQFRGTSWAALLHPPPDPATAVSRIKATIEKRLQDA